MNRYSTYIVCKVRRNLMSRLMYTELYGATDLCMVGLGKC